MDQDGDGVPAETSEDQFETTFALEAGPQFVGRFDFGTADSPVATEYTRVVHNDSYSAAAGYGWQTGLVYSINRGGDALTRDVNYTKDATFAMDLPNGEYDVTVTLGEVLIAHDQMGVFLEGVPFDSVSTAGGQFAVNTYRTSVSDGQLSLGLTDLGGSDSWVMINGLDVVFAGPDRTGPSVISTDAVGTVTGPIDRITLSFNESIQPGSFTLEDIAILEGPDGAITATAVNPLAAGEFEVTFEPQNTPGVYRLRVGPDVADVGGNLMDQDGDGVPAETSEDQFETMFTLEAGAQVVGRFDFGTADSPVATDYTAIVHTDSYSASIGYGWQTGTVYSINRGGDALTRDLNYTHDATFAVDLPNGEYDVTVTLGEVLISHDQMGVFLEGGQVDSITTAGGQFAVNTYRTSVSDGQLSLGLLDLGGGNYWVAINALDIVYVGPDLTGPRVTSIDAVGTVTGPIDRILVSFNEPIQAGSFTLEDIAVLDGPGGAIAATAVNPLSSSDFEVTFDPQNTSGLYHLVLGPGVADVAGNLMDQDGDGFVAEPVDDQFATTFTLEAGAIYVGRFDFGTADSPVATDYTPIFHTDRYSASIGYGWQSGTVYSINRGGDALTRDVNYTHDGTFAIDLPNGQYDVTVTLGEVLLSHDQMGVFLEGDQVDSVTTAGWQFAANTYRTSVSDGQLNLGLLDLGGSNYWVAINGLDIVLVGDTAQASVASLTTSTVLVLADDVVTANVEAEREALEHHSRLPTKIPAPSPTANSLGRLAAVHDRAIADLMLNEETSSDGSPSDGDVSGDQFAAFPWLAGMSS